MLYREIIAVTTVRYIQWPLWGTYSDHYAVHTVTTVRYIQWPLCGTYSVQICVYATSYVSFTNKFYSNFFRFDYFPSRYVIYVTKSVRHAEEWTAAAQNFVLCNHQNYQQHDVSHSRLVPFHGCQSPIFCWSINVSSAGRNVFLH